MSSSGGIINSPMLIVGIKASFNPSFNESVPSLTPSFTASTFDPIESPIKPILSLIES